MKSVDNPDPSLSPLFIAPRTGRPYEEREASVLFRQILSAMAYLHTNKIAHRLVISYCILCILLCTSAHVVIFFQRLKA